MSYDAILTVVAGLQRQATRQGLADALADPNFIVMDGASGKISFFSSSGERQPEPEIGTLIQVQAAFQSQFGYKFEKISPQ